MATGSEKYSQTVSQTLDNLGYSQDMIEQRRRFYYAESTVMNKRKYFFGKCPLSYVMAGSKAEGLTAPFESDTDTMLTMDNVICVNDSTSLTDQTDLTIFQTEMQETNPGYTRLKLIKFGKAILTDSLFQEYDGEWYISSNFLTENFKKHMYLISRDKTSEDVFLSQDGPACKVVSGQNNFFYSNVDHVLAFHCVCPGLLSAYINRPRKQGWPTLQVLDEIAIADAHVVPVGNIESANSYKEWRICFTKAETTLVRSLNKTQTKLYILLKIVCKSMIKKTFPAITSYVMKNIVLWIAETNPQELFTEELLLERLIQSLYFLKIRVESGFIPNYMIPDRNLLAGRINSTQQQELVTLLTSLIKAGPYLLLQCPKLHRGLAMMYSQLHEAVKFAMHMNNIEKTHLLFQEKNTMNISTAGITEDQIMDVLDNDPEITKIVYILKDLVIPNWRTLLQQGKDVETIVGHKLKKILS